MKRTRSKSTITAAVVGSVAFVLILTIGTLMTGLLATKDTQSAVESVSLLYLDELAGRREQVVSSNLSKSIKDMNIALELMTEDDLADIEHLQAYQARMKRIYNLEKFAFVDSKGTIYTANGIQHNIDEYDFDYKTISEPEISVRNIYGANKVVIAIPVEDLKCGNKKLVAPQKTDKRGTFRAALSLSGRRLLR